jgi:predicted RNA binding protein YcfA (HicA-like mRNA interferase family)
MNIEMCQAIIFGTQMSAKTKRLTSRQVIKRLLREDWYEVEGEGSHRNFKHDKLKGKITVPHPQRDFHPKTLRTIYKMAKWK